MGIKLTLGEKIKDCRTTMKKTIAEVCSDIQTIYSYKISVGKLTEMENDIDKDFGYKTFIYLSKYYNVSTDYLLGLSKEKSVDFNVQVACETTGLSEEAVTKLNKEKNIQHCINKLLTSSEMSELCYLINELERKSGKVKSSTDLCSSALTDVTEKIKELPTFLEKNGLEIMRIDEAAKMYLFDVQVKFTEILKQIVEYSDTQ